LRGALLFDNFLSLFKAVAAIGALSEGCISRFCIAIATGRGVAKISLTDCVADADIHGRRITPAKRLQQQVYAIYSQ
jgi:hypothetical protein